MGLILRGRGSLCAPGWSCSARAEREGVVIHNITSGEDQDINAPKCKADDIQHVQSAYDHCSKRVREAKIVEYVIILQSFFRMLKDYRFFRRYIRAIQRLQGFCKSWEIRRA